jgi:two-component system cell cycle response regulator
MTMSSESSGEALDDTLQIPTLDLPDAPTVLIVEDDELVLARLKELVTAAGYAVCTACSGVEALAALAERSPSIVVTDLAMPGMDGLNLCRRIREKSWPGYIYIVLLTVRDREEDILSGLEAGADDFVSKRTSAAQFTARLRIAKRVLGLEYSLKTALEKKHQLAMTDALTGAYNRRYLQKHLGRELKRAARFGGTLAVLLIDIDHFKRVNDTHGHVAGDCVLVELTRQIGRSLGRNTDWCARLGGEEFVVVLEGTGIAEARLCAEKLRSAVVMMAVRATAGPISITVSIGISGCEEFDDSEVRVEDLLERADGYLYASKNGGRNRVTSQGEPHAYRELPVSFIRRR